MKLWILTCCLKQRRQQDLFEVLRTGVPKRHTKYKRQKKNKPHIYDSTYRMAPLPDAEDLGS